MPATRATPVTVETVLHLDRADVLAAADARPITGGFPPCDRRPGASELPVGLLAPPRVRRDPPCAPQKQELRHTRAAAQLTEGGRMFPIDPSAPGGPERSEYVRRGHLHRALLHERSPTPNVRRQEEPRSAGHRRAG